MSAHYILLSIALILLAAYVNHRIHDRNRWDKDDF